MLSKVTGGCLTSAGTDAHAGVSLTPQAPDRPAAAPCGRSGPHRHRHRRRAAGSAPRKTAAAALRSARVPAASSRAAPEPCIRISTSHGVMGHLPGKWPMTPACRAARASMSCSVMWNRVALEVGFVTDCGPAEARHTTRRDRFERCRSRVWSCSLFYIKGQCSGHK